MEQKTFFSTNGNRLLGALVLISTILALVVYAYGSYKQTQLMYGSSTSIEVHGEGEVLAKPDIGTFSFSVNSKGADAASAQEESAKFTNSILTFLEESGVEDRDIKTQNYNLRPNYSYEERMCLHDGYCPPGERVIDGYEVTQSVTVKVRELDEAGDIISGVGERGATNISSLQFTIDDMDVLEEEARELAIKDAKIKAERLADDLGLEIVKIVGFSEESGGYYPTPYMAKATMAMDFAEEAAISPEIPVGENLVRQGVYISFEVK